MAAAQPVDNGLPQLKRVPRKEKSPPKSKAAAPPVAEFIAPEPVKAPPRIVPRVVEMTPEMAKDLLARNKRNRPIRKARVERYANEMKNGRWQLNGETIIVSDQGNLMNGQHRLHAVVTSETTVFMLLAEGIDEAAFSTMDSGLTRTAGDVLGMRGVSNFNQVSAITRLMLNYRDGAAISFPRTNKEIEDAVIRIPEIEDFVSNNGPLFTIGRSVAAACIFLAARFGPAEDSVKVQDFITGVLTGANLAEFDARLVYRNRMLAMNLDKKRRPEQVVVWYYTQRALGHFLNGTPISKLQAGRGEEPYFSPITSASRQTVKANW